MKSCVEKILGVLALSLALLAALVGPAVAQPVTSGAPETSDTTRTRTADALPGITSVYFFCGASEKVSSITSLTSTPGTTATFEWYVDNGNGFRVHSYNTSGTMGAITATYTCEAWVPVQITVHFAHAVPAGQEVDEATYLCPSSHPIYVRDSTFVDKSKLPAGTQVRAAPHTNSGGNAIGSTVVLFGLDGRAGSYQVMIKCEQMHST